MFTEGHVEVDGARLRYRHAGSGAPLVHLHGADGAPPTPAHELLASRFRVIALETPAAPGRALTSLGLESFGLMASSEAAPAALRLALEAPERVSALVLESPTGLESELARRLPEVGVPTLALFGTVDCLDVQQTGRVYAETIPNGHLVFVYDAAHAIGRDRPEAFAEVVGDFLERHEAFIISRTSTVIHP